MKPYPKTKKSLKLLEEVKAQFKTKIYDDSAGFDLWWVCLNYSDNNYSVWFYNEIEAAVDNFDGYDSGMLCGSIVMGNIRTDYRGGCSVQVSRAKEYHNYDMGCITIKD